MDHWNDPKLLAECARAAYRAYIHQFRTNGFEIKDALAVGEIKIRALAQRPGAKPETEGEK